MSDLPKVSIKIENEISEMQEMERFLAERVKIALEKLHDLITDDIIQ